jgi:hypothetical protein
VDATNESASPLHRFILQAIDPVLRCPVLATMLRVSDLEPLRPLLGPDASEDAELRGHYILEPDELRAIMERFGLAFDPEGRECWLSRAHSFDDAPYLIHTGYELALMLDGVKPFAVFATEYPAEPGEFPEEALFEPYVQSGRLVKRVIADEPFERPIRMHNGRVVEGIGRVFFARRGEEWRIDAHLLLWRQLEHGSWNETLERLDGILLGYTDAQNDWWIAHWRHNHASSTFSDSTAYAAVTAAELAWIHTTGERALPPEAALELVMHGVRPEPAALDNWIAASGAAAIVRFGLSRTFLSGREYGHRDGVRCYSITRSEMPALNRVLGSAIQVVAERKSM